MLWFALHLPWLPLEALAATPAACVHTQRSVWVADEAALAAGVRPGMSTASAAALLPGLRVLERAPLREAELLQLLALTLARFTPQLVVRESGLLLEVSASLRLFGGARALLAALRDDLRACGVRARVGIAPTAAAAWLLACVPARPGRARDAIAAREQLDRLPLPGALAALRIAPRLADLLQGIGARTLGDVRALPRAGLQRRGAGPLLQQLDRAYGDAPDPQAWFEPPRQFTLALELMQRADDAAMLAFAAQRLVMALAGWLARQWLGVAAFSLWLQHEATGRHAHPPTRLSVQLGQPSRDAAQIGLLLRERLQRCALPAPVCGLQLVLDEAVAQAGHEGQLWKDATHEAAHFRALLDRLSARLGAERVQRLVLCADHRPERAALARPALGPQPVSIAGPALPRPAWLLPAPLPLAEDAGRPVHGGPLVLRSAAERIEAGWFDGELVCRDYHVAEGQDHRLRWVFRQRQGLQTRWYLHGLFG